MVVQKDSKTVRLMSTDYPSSDWCANLNPNWETYYEVKEYPDYEPDDFFGKLIRFDDSDNMIVKTHEETRADGSDEMWFLGEELLLALQPNQYPNYNGESPATIER
tara:strand:+ start:5368 stop:5685 length:318 start_codon:yes stop_codon:yes gene_type:complete